MRVRLLGEVGFDGVAGPDAVPVGSRRSQLLLAALALADQAVTNEALADAIWGEDAPAHWLAAMRNAVSGLRSVLAPLGWGGDRLIATVPGGYRLARHDTVAVDVAEVLAAAAQGAALLAARRHDEAAAVVEAVVGDGVPELLPGIDLLWLAPHRAAVLEAHVRALEVLSKARSMRSDHATALTAAARAVDAAPLRESAHRALMSAHAEAGNRAEALRAFERCRRVLADELGVQPEEHTTALYLAVLGAEPTAPADVPAPSSPFVGRTGELAVVADALVPGALVTLVGPGGIGKTRLAVEACRAERARFEGGVLFVRFGPAVDDEMAGPTVAAAVGVATGSGVGPLDAVARRLAPAGPVALVLDGCEHAVDGTAELAVGLLERCPDLSVLATSRLPLTAPGEHLIPVLPLDSAGDGVELLRVRMVGAGVEVGEGDEVEALLAAICRQVGGFPLGVELVAREAVTTSLPDLFDRLALPEAGAAAGGDEATTTIGPVLDSSIGLLNEEERAVFDRLGVLGGPADLDLVRAVVAAPVKGRQAVDGRRVVRVLGELADRGLVSVDRGALRWRYEQHEVLRARARARLGAEGLWAGHEDLNDALVARLPTDPHQRPEVERVNQVIEVVRGHLGEAVAGRADASSALWLGYRLYRYWVAAGVTEGILWLRRLLDVAPIDGPARGVGSFALGYLLVWAGRSSDAVPCLEEAAARLGEAGDPLVASAHLWLGTAFESDAARASLHLELAIDSAHRFDLPEVVEAARTGVGTLGFEAGQRHEGLARWATAMSEHRRRGRDNDLVVRLPHYAWMLIADDRLDEAAAALDEAEARLGRRPRIAAALAAYTRARLHQLEDRHGPAREAAERSLDLMRAIGACREEPRPRRTLALVALAAGDGDEARAQLALAASEVRSSGERWMLPEVLDGAAVVAAGTGDHEVVPVLVAASDRQRRQQRRVRYAPDAREVEGALSSARQALGERRAREAAVAGGRLDAAAAMALLTPVEMSGSPGQVGWRGDRAPTPLGGR